MRPLISRTTDKEIKILLYPGQKKERRIVYAGLDISLIDSMMYITDLKLKNKTFSENL